MNEMFEMWSLPWHALQRSLADAFGADTDIGAVSTSKPIAGHAQNVPVAASWLARARAGATGACQSVR